MPKFSVTLCRAAYEYADVVVEADDSDSAEVQAVALADAKRVKGWETDEEYEQARSVNVEDLP